MKDMLSMAGVFKTIYSDLPEYQNLRAEDKKFFDNLFILLLFNEDKVYSNKYLSKRFDIPISTIEKRIHRLYQAGLIKRKVVNELVDSKWITKARTLELDSVTFSFVKAKSEEERIRGARQSALDKGNYIPLESITLAKEKVFEVADPPPEYHIEVRFE